MANLRRKIQLIAADGTEVFNSTYEGTPLQITYAAMSIAFINGIGANILPEDSDFPDVTFGDWGFIPVPKDTKRISNRHEDAPVLIKTNLSVDATLKIARSRRAVMIAT